MSYTIYLISTFLVLSIRLCGAELLRELLFWSLLPDIQLESPVCLLAILLPLEHFLVAFSSRDK